MRKLAANGFVRDLTSSEVHPVAAKRGTCEGGKR